MQTVVNFDKTLTVKALKNVEKCFKTIILKQQQKKIGINVDTNSVKYR